MTTTRLLSQFAEGFEECGAPCRGGREREGGREGACGAHYLPPAAGWSWRPKLTRCRRSSRAIPCPSVNIETGSWSSWTGPEESKSKVGLVHIVQAGLKSYQRFECREAPKTTDQSTLSQSSWQLNTRLFTHTALLMGERLTSCPACSSSTKCVCVCVSV